MKWSEKTWQAVEKIYEEILNLPFIKDLSKGTLSDERFKFYLIQDALYLNDYSRTLMNIALKLQNPEYGEAFMKFANDGVAVERILHESFLNGHVPSKSEMTPTCKLYTSYLVSSLYNPHIEVSLAAVLPCFWIYQKVGEHIYNTAETENNKYQNWINTYADESFAESTQKAIEICNVMADNCSEVQKQEMTEAFVLATKMEWMFWDSAYRLEKWPV
ncbi:MAG: TenA family protein [Bacteroidales bacterium]|jgi:thiaminase/transcriptional activator TenA|nr:TenA family protein [Bacteroidales bacterium]